MAIPRNSNFTVYNAVGLVGPAETVNSVVVYPLLADGTGDILFATGVTVPTNASTGFAKSCLFIDTDVAAMTGSLYLNKGTNTSCQFSLVTQA